ncbi:hypothetical protein Tco_1554629 [Tanacetum coccineum]
MVEQEPVKKMSKKDLLRLDEELAFKLQAEEEEEERLAREKAQQVEEANIAWDDVQLKLKLLSIDTKLASTGPRAKELTMPEKGKIVCTILRAKKKIFCSKESLKRRGTDSFDSIYTI